MLWKMQRKKTEETPCHNPAEVIEMSLNPFLLVSAIFLAGSLYMLRLRESGSAAMAGKLVSPPWLLRPAFGWIADVVGGPGAVRAGTVMMYWYAVISLAVTLVFQPERPEGSEQSFLWLFLQFVVFPGCGWVIAQLCLRFWPHRHNQPE